ncbi:hypothetical protein PDIG_16990 [Penicillium digitatum PHI26]|uniref:Uncharacterized protein n=1 Tax=Penicillium digitatum (strain PHI26 / CECT 20796) TaxID=1170229 RepID=K9G7V1_PEND2|nr:hypothetical protein PDIG_16990 [Penicillium digitatum PHI26]
MWFSFWSAFALLIPCTLSKFDPLTLDHVVACKAFPNQVELAAIMSQVYSSLIPQNER